MSHQAKETILKHVLPNEKLIWTGTPKQGIVFRTPDLYIIPFSLFWCYFVYLWFSNSNVINNQPIEIDYLLMGIPHLLIGIHLLFGRFLYDSYRRKNTLYGLTDKRAIIVTKVFHTKTNSIQIDKRSNISITEQKNDMGTIHFEKLKFWQSFFAKGKMNGLKDAHLPQFELIKDAKSVYNKILSIQNIA